MASVYPHIPNLEEEFGIIAIKKGLLIAKEIKDVSLQSRFLSSLAWQFSPKDFKKAEEYAQQALKLSESLPKTDRYTEREALDAMAKVYRENAQHKKSIQFLERALEITKQIGDIHLESETLNKLAYGYNCYITLQEKTQEALEQCLSIRERIGFHLHHPLSNLGRFLMRQGKWEDTEGRN